MKKQRFKQLIIMVICAVFVACAGFAVSDYFKRENTITAHAETEVTSTIFWAVSGDTLKIGSTEQSGLPIGNFSGGYYHNWESQITDKSAITRIEVVDEISPMFMTTWFRGFVNLTDISSLSNIDTSNCKDMTQVFYQCESLTSNSLEAIKNWNTSNVTDMSYMFGGCSSLTSLESIKDWNVSQVSTFSGMFWTCSQLQSVEPLKNWTASPKDINMIFYGCRSIQSISSSCFNVSNCTNFNSVFGEMTQLRSIDMSGWTFNSATNIRNMFVLDSSLEILKFNDSYVNALKRLSTQNESVPFPLHDAEGITYNSVSDLTSGGTYYTSVAHVHVFSSDGVVTKPTCKDKGYTTKHCDICDMDVQVDFVDIDPTAHVWSKWTTKTAADCTHNEVQKRTCSVCNEEETQTLTGTATGHSKGTHHEAVDATCSKTGNVEYWECANDGCDCLLNSSNQAVSSVTVQINPNAHSFTNYVSNNNATCTDNATETADCENGCGQTDTREILNTAKGHKWAAAWSKDATNHWHVCENDGCTAKGGETAHVYNWVTDTPATLTDTGIQHEECLCGAKRSENTVIPIQTCAHAHLTHYDRVEATCAATGNVEYWHCDDCNKNLNSVNTEISDVTIPVDNTAHVFTNYVSDNNATCTADGTKTAQCDHGCGATDTVTDTGSMTQHTYEWEITKQPTKDEEGEKQEKCTVCGNIGATETIAKLIKDPNGNGDVSDLPPDKDYDLEIAVKESDNLYTYGGINKGFKVELFIVDGDNKVEYDKDKEVTLTLVIPEEMKGNFTLYVRRGDVLEPVSAEEYTVINGSVLSIRTKLPNEFVFNAPAPEEPAAGIPWWVWLIVGLAGAAVIGVVAVIIVVAKKKSAAAVVVGEAYDDAELKAKLSEQDKKLDEIKEIVDGGFNDIVDDE